MGHRAREMVYKDCDKDGSVEKVCCEASAAKRSLRYTLGVRATCKRLQNTTRYGAQRWPCTFQDFQQSRKGDEQRIIATPKPHQLE